MIFICLCFLAAFIDSIVGGGGLISLPAVIAHGVPIQFALGTNKLIGISAATLSSIRYSRSGLIVWSLTGTMFVCSFIFAGLGAKCSTLISPKYLQSFIFFALLFILIYTLWNQKYGLKHIQKREFGKGILCACAGILGFYDGFFGPGTGSFLIMMWIQLRGMSFMEASANGRILNFASNLGAILFFASQDLIQYKVVLPGMCAALLGGYVGSKWALSVGSKGVRILFILVVSALLLKLGWKIVTA